MIMKYYISFILLSFLIVCFGFGSNITEQSGLINKIPQHNNVRSLTFMTLNIAHGRKNKFHQALLNKNKIKENLNDIIRIFIRETPYVVALQETDGPSFWSGNFNHVEYLSTQASFNSNFQGYHVNNFGLHYGTAILASSKLEYSKSHTLTHHSFISLPKGFVLSTIKWPSEHNLYIDVISVHLDFLLDSVRQKQIEEIVSVMKERNNPIILMGDLNADSSSSAFNYLIDNLNLKTYELNKIGLETFSRSNKRIDWILISKEMEFISYKVINDKLSDHNAVISEIALIRK
ncbi:MAG TPA: hypothetical protein EYG49_06660 [Gammaproteobacteria bacterium]|nr:hypothetical protein [Gammaproteobacteria bacterium]